MELRGDDLPENNEVAREVVSQASAAVAGGSSTTSESNLLGIIYGNVHGRVREGRAQNLLLIFMIIEATREVLERIWESTRGETTTMFVLSPTLVPIVRTILMFLGSF